jgi:hypothetical protein
MAGQIILALDHGTNLGWSLGRGSSTPRWGSHRLPSPDGDAFGRVWRAYGDWLSDMITVHAPTLIVKEAPLINEHMGQQAARMLMGLDTLAEYITELRDVEVMDVHVATVRKHFCGSGHAKKDDVGFECRQRGWMVADHNAADALAVLSFARDALGVGA